MSPADLLLLLQTVRLVADLIEAGEPLTDEQRAAIASAAKLARQRWEAKDST